MANWLNGRMPMGEIGNLECYPVTKEFREKLYAEIVSQYEKAKEQSENKAKEAAQTKTQPAKGEFMRVDGKELPFR